MGHLQPGASMLMRVAAAIVAFTALLALACAQAQPLCTSAACNTCLTRCTQSEAYCLQLGESFGPNCAQFRARTCPQLCDAHTRGNKPAPAVETRPCADDSFCKMSYPNNAESYRQCMLMCRN
jgi:hypothetical protein